MKNREPISMPVCICTMEMESVMFRAWSYDNCPTAIIALSCTNPGCSGNIKERNERYVTAMQKLTDEEKKLLGLWYYPDKSRAAGTGS